MIMDDQKFGKVKITKSNASCCVPLCDVSGYVMEEHIKITFHKLPIHDKKRMKEWCHQMRRDPGAKFNITKHTTICSRHFVLSDFVTTAKGRRFLIKSAIPSQFQWTKPDAKRSRKLHTIESKILPHVAELQEKISQLEAQLKTKTEAAELFRTERDKLKKTASLKGSLSIESIKDNEKLLCFYTGFPTYVTFEQCLRLIDPGLNGKNIIYSRKKANARSKRLSHNKKLSVENEFLMMLVRLRLGLFVEDLAIRFGISKSSVNRILLTWINYTYLKLGNICIWPNQDTIRATIPSSMKEKYPNLEWIIDAFEIQTERPSSLVLQSKSYSTYKSRNTIKGILACTPSGQIGFISQLYHGSMSDRELTIRSGFLKMPHNRGAMWLVDKGFQIGDLAEPLGVVVNMPAFLGDHRKQMSKAEVYHTQQVASERIHIERAINKVKNFHIFDSCIPMSMTGTVNQMWTVCALLTLFQRPIISA